jgi:hypothetical protein
VSLYDGKDDILTARITERAGISTNKFDQLGLSQYGLLNRDLSLDQGGDHLASNSHNPHVQESHANYNEQVKFIQNLYQPSHTRLNSHENSSGKFKVNNKMLLNFLKNPTGNF